jgi:NitT/TauT family transport system substrate-binding protein
MPIRIRGAQVARVAALICLIGCEAQPQSPTAATNSKDRGGTQAQSAEALTPVEIQLNWKPEAEHGGYYAAVVHGYYAEEGLHVKLTPGGPGTPLRESVATNRIPFGVDNADKLISARAEEADIVAVFAPIQDSPRCIMVHAESGISKLDDLATAEGVTLAWNDAQPFAKFLSKKFDLTKLTMTKYSGVGPFLLDKKYAMQAYNISEPYLAMQQGAKPVNLMLSDAGFNTYTSLLLTNPKVIRKQPELVHKVVRASLKGWQKYLTDAVETNRHIAELNPEMPEDVLDYGVAELQRLCRPRDLPEDQIGRMDLERWQKLVEQMETTQLIDANAVKAESAFTTEFLPDAK